MQLSDDFSIRMSSADSLAPPADLFATRPDRKGQNNWIVAGCWLNNDDIGCLWRYISC